MPAREDVGSGSIRLAQLDIDGRSPGQIKAVAREMDDGLYRVEVIGLRLSG
jgi:hypothetical protein